MVEPPSSEGGFAVVRSSLELKEKAHRND